MKERGFKLLGVRLLPTDNKALGASALATEPHVLQMFVENTKENINDKDFDRCVFDSDSRLECSRTFTLVVVSGD